MPAAQQRHRDVPRHNETFAVRCLKNYTTAAASPVVVVRLALLFRAGLTVVIVTIAVIVTTIAAVAAIVAAIVAAGDAAVVAALQSAVVAMGLGGLRHVHPETSVRLG